MKFSPHFLFLAVIVMCFGVLFFGFILTGLSVAWYLVSLLKLLVLISLNITFTQSLFLVANYTYVRHFQYVSYVFYTVYFPLSLYALAWIFFTDLSYNNPLFICFLSGVKPSYWCLNFSYCVFFSSRICLILFVSCSSFVLKKLSLWR